ncbi:MAG: lactate permease LctP family transporter [Selenomonadaceae bacterium]|nr:lactate permease LctP family transporter [Selenomonadaceae bacterium]
MTTLFFAALVPIILLIIALSGLKLPAYQACTIALVSSFFMATQFFGMPYTDAVTAALEGTAMAAWPIIWVIIAAIFTYNLSVFTKGMDTIKEMLGSVTTDERVLVLLIAWGFGGFLECMSGFGTAVAIGASMLASIGINPISAIIVCLLANAMQSSYGSIGLPLTTLAQLTNFDSAQIATFATLQLGTLIVIMPFLMVVIFGGSMKALNGMVPICLVAGLGFLVPALFAGSFMGAGLSGVAGAIFSMGLIAVYAKKFPVHSSEYEIKSVEESSEITFDKGLKAWLPFILIFVFLIATSKLVPPINELLIQAKTSIQIYTGEGAGLYTFSWIVTPGTLIMLAAVISGFVQGASVSDMFSVLGRTIRTMIPTFITMITIISTARIMGYSGMITTMATVTVAVTGTMYPFISPLIGSMGSFITGSATTSGVLFGKLQADAALAIGATEIGQSWMAAANAAGACVGKIISPQSIAIGVAAVGIHGVESQIMKFAVKVYLPFVILMGAIVYFGRGIVESL